MFKINLEENAGVAYLESLDALKKILDGEGNYKNYRAYVLNLHSALELFFKKKLFDHNEFMLFSFSNYQKMMEKYEKAFKANQTLFDYIESSNSNLPHTVTFEDAIQRLAYLYKENQFTINYITMLNKLNTIRNDITHFELSLQDDQLVLLNELFIACTDYYSEYVEWGYNLPIDLNKIRDKNFTIQKAIVTEPFNRHLLYLLDNSRDSLVDDLLDFSFLATCLIENGDYEEKEKEKLVKRLQIFENAGLFEFGSASGEHWNVGWFYLSDICKSLLQ